MQEDIVTKLIEFLVAPHPTTTVLLAEKEQVVHLNFKFIIKMPLYGTMFLLWLLSFYVCSIYQSIKGKKRKRVVKRNSSMSGSTSSKRSAKVSFYFWQNEKYRLSVYYYLWYDTMLHSLVVCLCETSLGKNWSLVIRGWIIFPLDPNSFHYHSVMHRLQLIVGNYSSTLWVSIRDLFHPGWRCYRL